MIKYNHNINFFNTLPLDVLNTLFQLFDVKTLLTISRVCKTWRSLANNDKQWQRFLSKKYEAPQNCKLLFLNEQHETLNNATKELNAEKLCYFSKKQLNPLIYKSYIILDEVFKLSQPEFLNLSNKFIQRLIFENVLTIEEAKKLSSQERANLAHPHIQTLILKGCISLQEAKVLTRVEVTNLSDSDLYPYIESHTLEVNSLKKMNHLQRQEFKNKTINNTLRFI